MLVFKFLLAIRGMSVGEVPKSTRASLGEKLKLMQWTQLAAVAIIELVILSILCRKPVLVHLQVKECLSLWAFKRPHSEGRGWNLFVESNFR